MSDFRNNPENRQARMARMAESAAKGRSEADAENRRVEANTVRLRALRLAKETADAAAAALAPPKATKGKKAAKKTPAKAAKKAPAKAIKVEDLNAEDDG